MRANVNAVDFTGQTPLLWSTSRGEYNFLVSQMLVFPPSLLLVFEDSNSYRRGAHHSTAAQKRGRRLLCGQRGSNRLQSVSLEFRVGIMIVLQRFTGAQDLRVQSA